MALSSPASAALVGPGLDPTVADRPGGIPAQGSCGVGGFGDYVKFTTGGGSVDNASATTTGGKPFVATYSQNETTGLFRVETLTQTPSGTPVLFNEIVGGVSNLNPIWQFDPTLAPSPTLNITSNNNFSQWALCVYTNVTFSVTKKVVGSPTTQAFDIKVDCVLDDPADTLPPISNHFDLSLANGATSALLTVPKGSVCVATESATGFTVSISPASLGPILSSGSLITVTNTRNTTSLKITKTQVGGTAQVWTFDVNCSGPFGETFQSLNVPITGSGNATVTGIPTGLSCTVTEDQANSGGFTTTVDPVGSINVGTTGGSVGFTNTAPGSLKITKVNNGGPASQTFTIGYNCGVGFTGSVSLVGGGTQTISGIPAGRICTLSETPTGYTPSFSVNPTTITAGGTAEVVVTNTRNTTSLTITKTQNGGTAQAWTFDVNCGTAPGETFQALDVLITGSNTATVSGIPTGLSCTVTEDQANSGGFDTTVVPAGVINVGNAGGAIAFTNTKRANVTITKTQNGGAPTFQYTFRLTGGPDGVSIARTTLVDPSPLDFGLVKPGSYTLCELAVPAGTTSGLASLPGATINATTGDVCAPITLTAGQNLSITIDNQLRTGGQRTIGYWRNWNTCASSNGNQLANAAKTGKTLLDQVLPLKLGNYTVDTCAKGVAVLSNQAGKYAENQLAAQLLAAKANVVVGAACGTINAVITQADALLVGIGYSTSPSSIVGSNHPQRATFTSVASTLDRFNNGLLC